MIVAVYVPSARFSAVNVTEFSVIVRGLSIYSLGILPPLVVLRVATAAAVFPLNSTVSEKEPVSAVLERVKESGVTSPMLIFAETASDVKSTSLSFAERIKDHSPVSSSICWLVSSESVSAVFSKLSLPVFVPVKTRLVNLLVSALGSTVRGGVTESVIYPVFALEESSLNDSNNPEHDTNRVQRSKSNIENIGKFFINKIISSEKALYIL